MLLSVEMRFDFSKSSEKGEGRNGGSPIKRKELTEVEGRPGIIESIFNPPPQLPSHITQALPNRKSCRATGSRWRGSTRCTVMAPASGLAVTVTAPTCPRS